MDNFFILKYSEDDLIFYIPKYHICGKATHNTLINFPVERLKEIGIPFPEENLKEKDIKRIGLTVCLTEKCNMECVYCYANSGISNKTIDVGMIKHVINSLISMNPDYKFFHLSFHGGGEPFVEFDTMKAIITYAKEKTRGKYLTINSVTNGVLNGRQIEYVLENKIGLNISLDGPPKIQNLQRPLRNNKPSYEKVINTIKILLDNNVKPPIRSTITDFSAQFLKEIVENIVKLDLEILQLEPMAKVGRAINCNFATPDPETFSKNFIEAYEYGEDHNILVYCSGSRIGGFTDRFCNMSAARKDYLCITPEGYVTACVEVSKKEDSASEVFYYGKYDEFEKRIKFNENKIEQLRKRLPDNLPSCKKCFAKYDCAGDCAIKFFRINNSLFEKK